MPEVYPLISNTPPRSSNTTGSNLSVAITNSSFSECSAVTEPSSVQPGAANGGGGAVYVYGAAVSSVTLSDASFSSCFVRVASGYVGGQDEASYSAGGALAVDVPGSDSSVVGVFSCSFVNCSARGAGIPSVAVRGGAVAVSRASRVVTKKSTFVSCSVQGAVVNADINGVKETGIFSAVSGGAGMSSDTRPRFVHRRVYVQRSRRRRFKQVVGRCACPCFQLGSISCDRVTHGVPIVFCGTKRPVRERCWRSICAMRSFNIKC